ncbi:CMD domain protein [Leucobacter sp. NPDC077196]|uniref:CMD domain protein n=1 Tax=Leucobacter sp. NPDC077196 TaxID=3154959 RepID=UPI003427BFED
MTRPDTLSALAGLDAEAAARLQGRRPEATDAAEASLHALFDVGDDDEAAGLPRYLRLLFAARAARVDGAHELAEFYLELIDEERDGEAGTFSIDDAHALVIGGVESAAGRPSPRRIRAALRHVDLLVQRPAAATSDDLDALSTAGWSVTETVVLSQIVSFVTYQTRVVAGLRVLQEARA